MEDSKNTFDDEHKKSESISQKSTNGFLNTLLKFNEINKYAILLIITVIVLKMAGVDFTNITQIGKDGITFSEKREQNTVNAITENMQMVKELKKRLELLEISNPKISGRSPASVDSTVATNKLIENEIAQAHTATDTIAKLATTDGKQPLFKNKVGYIFIGNYNTDGNKWSHQFLTRIDTGQKEVRPVKEITSGSQYYVDGNMVLRESLPKNDENYYNGVPSIGVIPKGTKISIVETPVAIDRKFAVQCWAKVEVL